MPEADVEFSVDFENLTGLMGELGGFVSSLNIEEADELWSELDDLMEIIKKEYVPIDEGDLAASGYVTEPELNGADGFDILLGFEEDYALIQHERLDFKHSHGQAKYLEEPLAAFLGIHIKNKQSEFR